MFVLVRAITWSTLFIGLVLVLLPARLLGGRGAAPPEDLGAAQVAGLCIAIAGGALALSCIATFVIVGKGTPAPFDPPLRLVARGPYAVIRNPMYLGAGLAVAGASLFYGSLALLGYAVGFLLATHLFVVAYEEPTLRGTFGAEYDAYRRRVGRWWPSGVFLQDRSRGQAVASRRLEHRTETTAMKPDLNQLDLVVRDMEATLAFYRALGVDIPETAIWRTATGVHHVDVTMPGGLIVHFDSAPLARVYNRGWREPSGTGTRSVHSFHVSSREEVDRIHEKLTGLGHRSSQPPYDAFWGARYAIVEDPDGNHIGIMSPRDPSRRTAPPDL